MVDDSSSMQLIDDLSEDELHKDKKLKKDDYLNRR